MQITKLFGNPKPVLVSTILNYVSIIFANSPLFRFDVCLYVIWYAIAHSVNQ